MLTDRGCSRFGFLGRSQNETMRLLAQRIPASNLSCTASLLIPATRPLHPFCRFGIHLRYVFRCLNGCSVQGWVSLANLPQGPVHRLLHVIPIIRGFSFYHGQISEENLVCCGLVVHSEAAMRVNPARFTNSSLLALHPIVFR